MMFFLFQSLSSCSRCYGSLSVDFNALNASMVRLYGYSFLKCFRVSSASRERLRIYRVDSQRIQANVHFCSVAIQISASHTCTCIVIILSPR